MALDLLRTRKYEYLRNLTCGFAGQIPLVCCKQFGRNIPDISTDGSEVPPEVTSPKTPSTVTSPKTPPTVSTVSTTSTTEAAKLGSRLLTPPNCGFSNITNYKVVGGIPAKPRKSFFIHF